MDQQVIRPMKGILSLRCIECHDPATRVVTIHQWNGDVGRVLFCSTHADKQMDRSDMQQEMETL
jgi:hypothetical protein